MLLKNKDGGSPSIRDFQDEIKRKRTEKRRKAKEKSVWSVPPLWNGSTSFILGGGPSLNNVNLDLIRKRRIIAVNNAFGDPVKDEEGNTIAYKPRDWIDIVFFGDERWYRWHRKSLKEFYGLIVTSRSNLHKTDKKVLATCRGKAMGLEKRRRFIAWNKSSGAAAINLAFHLGSKRIVLLGFDMRRVDDCANWHKDHPSPDKNPYERFLTAFPLIKRDAEKAGLEIINCTPDSALTIFPIMTLEEYLEGEKNDLS